ncbi:MAG: DUF4344 domain-containing metallopeptidase [Thaumarchaeota archaeon]|nr:DUF4344 domain-containing metallopeptidase [Nitrososphaerota archaeon]
MNGPGAAALCAALACAALLPLAIPDAGAERTSLRLDPVPRLVEGQHATFTGTLVAASGYPVSGALVEIKDDDPGFDDLIATARTGSDGRFAARVVVKDWDRWGGASDIYAVFEGGGGFSKSRSATQEAPVLPAGSSPRQSGAQQSAGQQPGVYAQSTHPTRIQLYFDKSKVYAGDTVTFSGTLTAGGRALSGATVHIKEDDRFLRDEFLASVKTDHNGRFSTVWRASAALIEKDFDVYAVFEGAGEYLRSKTPTYQLTVLKKSGSITLDPIPRGVHIGDPVTFSGSLSLQGIDTTNVIVYIKDEDRGNPDDLLATAYVDGNGRYAVTWIAQKVDYDKVADIYAVFEGDSSHYRLTTCDPGPTWSFGGLCRNTRPLTTWPARPVALPGPSNFEYIDLDYVIQFQGRPTVAILPSPDSYDKARHHIIPTREGIATFSSELAARHGGDWLVDFEILTPGKWRADARADVVVNIITGDDNNDCNESYGWAPGSPRALPIQIHVCSTTYDLLRASQAVMRTATHEFAHAVGLGHTFNKRNDMMCSVEDSRATCPGTHNKELRPSKLVLDAMAELYGRDGYAVPNNNVHKDYFAYGSSKTAGTDRTGSWARQNPASGGETSLTLEIAPSKKFSEYASYVKSLNYFAPEIAYLNDKLVLPHDTNVRVGECGRASDLYYPDLHAIRICYEDIKEYVSTAHNLEYSDEDTHNYVMSNLEFALYRGIGYALIDSFVPNNPAHRAEAAASFAAYLILTTYEAPDTGHDILYDASTQLYVYSESNRDNAALREHALGRFNLLTCYAYGQDPEAREYLSTEGWLPDNIRDSCESLYDNVVRMWEGIMPGYLKA